MPSLSCVCWPSSLFFRCLFFAEVWVLRVRRRQPLHTSYCGRRMKVLCWLCCCVWFLILYSLFQHIFWALSPRTFKPSSNPMLTLHAHFKRRCHVDMQNAATRQRKEGGRCSNQSHLLIWKVTNTGHLPPIPGPPPPPPNSPVVLLYPTFIFKLISI